MSVARLRSYQGPAILSYGFRPFFLLGSIYAGAMIPLWLGIFAGDLELPTAFAPRDWHIHEMLFGYVAAILGGFLLTAVPNWTGRLPLQGTPLAVLVSAWLAGPHALAFRPARCGHHRIKRVLARGMDCGPGVEIHRVHAADRGCASRYPARALGRRSHDRRSAGPYPSSGLRVRSAWLCSLGSCRL
jgi:NnrS protein